MKVICFGDSNTYGYDPRGYFGGRYDADSRWVDILAANTGQPLEVVEKDTDRDNYMSAEEALAYGLIDGVVTHK